MSEIDVSWNPLDKGSGVVLSGGNKIAAGSSAFHMVRADVGRNTGKLVYQLELTSADAGVSNVLGFATSSASLTSHPGGSSQSAGLQWKAYAPPLTQPHVAGMTRANGFAVPSDASVGSRVTFAHDIDAGECRIALNGSWMAGGAPVVTYTPGLTIFPAAAPYNGANSVRLRTLAADIDVFLTGYQSWAGGELVEIPLPSLPGFFTAQHFGSAGRSDIEQIIASTALPSSFVIAPGNYVFGGYGFNCSAPGLYRFWDGATPVIQTRAVFGGDLYEFLSAISWHHVHGLADEQSVSVPPASNSAYWQAIFNSGMTSKWEMRCGYIATMMVWLLPQYGYQARVINLVTAGPTNGVDDGHIVFEVFDSGKWKLWDITSGVYFTLNGVHLSAAEIIAAGVLNCQRVNMGAPDKFNSVTTVTQSPAIGFDIGSYMDMRHLTPADIDTWFFEKYQAWSVG